MRAREKLTAERVELLHQLTECEDRTPVRGTSRQLARLRERVAALPLAQDARSAELAQRVRELHGFIFNGEQAMEELYLNRLNALADGLAGAKQDRRSRMSIFDRLRSRRTEREGEARQELMHSQEYQAEHNVFELQKKIIALSQELKRQTAAFQEKVDQCAALPRDSYDYKLAHQQAAMLRPRISMLGKQLKLYGKTLENNAQYKAMLEAGRMTFQLRDYMPDSAMADLLLKAIQDETQDMVGEMENMGKMLDDYGAATDLAVDATSSALEDDREFDLAVERRQAEWSAEAEAAKQREAEEARCKAEAAQREAEEAQRREAEAAQKGETGEGGGDLAAAEAHGPEEEMV